MTLKLQGNPVKDWTGVFYLGDNGELKYIGGAAQADGSLTAAVTHFSKYTALQINTVFKDVPDTHWASAAIKSLAAKQVATGVSAAEFEPARNVTRAEFTALLMRALGLSGEGRALFADVQADAWYASYVAAAVQSGIVNGRSSTAFAPDATISREEMAVMIIRALEFKQGKVLASSTGQVLFADASSISEWAHAYVNAAVELKLVQGRDHHLFAPQGQLTRAESAQVIYKLLGK